MTKKTSKKEISLSDKIYIYSSGIVSCSVCADKNLTRKQIENHVNLVNPTGIQYSWKISKDKKFHTGQPMPCQCEENDNCKHWLLNC